MVYLIEYELVVAFVGMDILLDMIGNEFVGCNLFDTDRHGSVRMNKSIKQRKISKQTNK